MATHLVTGFPPSSAEGSKPTSREVADVGSTWTTKGGAACVQGASFAGLDSAPATENPSCEQDIPTMKHISKVSSSWSNNSCRVKIAATSAIAHNAAAQNCWWLHIWWRSSDSGQSIWSAVYRTYLRLRTVEILKGRKLVRRARAPGKIVPWSSNILQSRATLGVLKHFLAQPLTLSH